MNEPFDFFEALNGREIFHYSGAPVFIESYPFPGKVYVRDMQGAEFLVDYKELESPTQDEMNEYV